MFTPMLSSPSTSQLSATKNIHDPLIRHVLDIDSINFTSQEQKDAVDTLISDFTVGPKLLCAIKDQFKAEMALGLASDGQDLAMIPTYVMGRLNGSETGSFVTLDIGGTFLRIVHVELLGQGTLNTRQQKYRIDNALKTSKATQLFDFTAASVISFLEEHRIIITESSELELGFTFSYPVLQKSINSGTLIQWTKGFQAEGLVGQDPAAFLQKAFVERGVPIRVAALINDTVGTLLAHAYRNTGTFIGLGFGTGTNGAYLEQIDRISKWHGDRQGHTEMIINMEFGGFDSKRHVLPFTKYDTELDRQSLNQGEQLFEKLIAGMYLGEITRRILSDLKDRGILFQGADSWAMDTMWSFDTAQMCIIETDSSPQLAFTGRVLQNVAKVADTCLFDRQIVKMVVQLVGRRAARLSSVALAGILDHLAPEICSTDTDRRISVGVDGSLYHFYPDFEKDILEGLGDVLGPQARYRINLGASLDGSSVGAALASALSSEPKINQKHSDSSNNSNYNNKNPPGSSSSSSSTSSANHKAAQNRLVAKRKRNQKGATIPGSGPGTSSNVTGGNSNDTTRRPARPGGGNGGGRGVGGGGGGSGGDGGKRVVASPSSSFDEQSDVSDSPQSSSESENDDNTRDQRPSKNPPVHRANGSSSHFFGPQESIDAHYNQKKRQRITDSEPAVRGRSPQRDSQRDPQQDSTMSAVINDFRNATLVMSKIYGRSNVLESRLATKHRLLVPPIPEGSHRAVTQEHYYHGQREVTLDSIDMIISDTLMQLCMEKAQVSEDHAAAVRDQDDDMTFKAYLELVWKGAEQEFFCQAGKFILAIQHPLERYNYVMALVTRQTEARRKFEAQLQNESASTLRFKYREMIGTGEFNLNAEDVFLESVDSNAMDVQYPTSNPQPAEEQTTPLLSTHSQSEPISSQAQPSVSTLSSTVQSPSADALVRVKPEPMEQTISQFPIGSGSNHPSSTDIPTPTTTSAQTSTTTPVSAPGPLTSSPSQTTSGNSSRREIATLPRPATTLPPRPSSDAPVVHAFRLSEPAPRLQTTPRNTAFTSSPTPTEGRTQSPTSRTTHSYSSSSSSSARAPAPVSTSGRISDRAPPDPRSLSPKSRSAPSSRDNLTSSTISESPSQLSSNDKRSSHHSIPPASVTSPSTSSSAIDNLASLVLASAGSLIPADLDKQISILRKETQDQSQKYDTLHSQIEFERKQREQIEKQVEEYHVELKSSRITTLEKELEARRFEAVAMLAQARQERANAREESAHAREEVAKARQVQAEMQAKSAMAQIECLKLRALLNKHGITIPDSFSTMATTTTTTKMTTAEEEQLSSVAALSLSSSITPPPLPPPPLRSSSTPVVPQVRLSPSFQPPLVSTPQPGFGRSGSPLIATFTDRRINENNNNNDDNNNSHIPKIKTEVAPADSVAALALLAQLDARDNDGQRNGATKSPSSSSQGAINSGMEHRAYSPSAMVISDSE
ncbi:glucokinase [Podila humilis]|nr:glucokinase [Podila humilis]